MNDQINIESIPRVSIGLPVYNGENFLQKTLDSLLQQTFEDFELIICDNASTDGTSAICREYATKDSRIRYYRNEQNFGAAPNYNKTFNLAQGEYFKWAAHDDLCAPEYLQECVEILDSNPSVVLSYSQTQLIDSYNHPIEPYFYDDLHLRLPEPHKRFGRYHEVMFYGSYKHRKITPIFGLIRADVLRKTRLIGSYIASDWVLLSELALLGEYHEIPKKLFLRREHFQRSTKAHHAIQDRAIWFDVSNQGKILLPGWRLLFEFLWVIWRVPINWQEKIYCCIELRKWFFSKWWGWKRMIKDLIALPQQVYWAIFPPIH